ncbi:hypothetical protein [Halorubrum tebenquichense]|uniref:hypothetical protein n=1 Tax=Halorubrum tebenquichense TaxID=119434 RepID=UPI0012691015|nr:hypothetical protein [Halorubrum tebenquichense]
MTNIGIPTAWTKKREEGRYSAAVVEYHHEIADETLFVVSVIPKIDDGKFELRLLAINRTSTHVRHDYPIDEYDTVEDAVEGAESFIEMLSQRLAEGSLSPSDPQIEAIRETITTFRGDRSLPTIGRLIRRFR